MTAQPSDDVIDDLFLFAHQDDEFAAVHLIERGIREGRRQLFMFLTNGKVPGGADSASRNKETIAALKNLGVSEHCLAFAGTSLDLPDGQLFKHLSRALAGLEDIVGSRRIDRVILPAWEGGHPDHDAVHLVGLALARRKGCLDRSMQLPFYRAKAGFPGIAIFSPLAANGEPIVYRRTVSQVLSHLALARYYPTQARYFVGILPLTLSHYLGDRNLYSQPVDVKRVCERPAARLKYEGRHSLTFAEFRAATSKFIEAKIVCDEHTV